MKKQMLLMAVLAGNIIPVTAQDADVLIKKVKSKLEKVNDYEASAVMKTDVSFMKIPESSVTIYYKKPDKFKVKKQNGISVMPKGGVSINLNSLFTGDKFTAVAAGNSTVNGMAVTVVKLLPLDEKSEVVVSTLYIDEKESLIRKAMITTKDNGTYEMELTYGKFASWGLPDKVIFLFNTKDYKLPKGLAFDYDTGEKPAKANSSHNQKGRIEISYTTYSINTGVAESVFQ